ncbi:MAG TPA: Spy/CpxP family protein refolding chaperone [Terriglobales bacterium]|jgi:protein CpxP|nr:Spy/CpxP family protein refolding chaperone [Terriglobales bacterium]
MLKRYAITLVLALFAMGAYSFAQQDQSQPAQNPNSPGQHEHNGGRGGWGPRDPQQMVQHMTQELNLTSDQQSKVLAILQDQQKQMQALHDDTTTPQEDKRAKAMDLHKNTMSQVRAVLTDEQQKKFDEMQQKREQEMGQHRKNSEGNEQPKSDDQPKPDQK